MQFPEAKSVFIDEYWGEANRSPEKDLLEMPVASTREALMSTNSARPFEEILLEQQQKVKQNYKDITQFIKEKYMPHFNLYQKAMIVKKLKCYEDNISDPSVYYGCVDKIDQAMQTNSLRLKQTFAKIDEKDQECQEECTKTLSGSDKFVSCMEACQDKLKKQSVEVYESFYKTTIADNTEYKKIKK